MTDEFEIPEDFPMMLVGVFEALNAEGVARIAAGESEGSVMREQCLEATGLDVRAMVALCEGLAPHVADSAAPGALIQAALQIGLTVGARIARARADNERLV